MNKHLIKIASIALFTMLQANSTSVAEMMQKDGVKNVVGWIDYEKDSDKDGVADYLDKCPNTPKGVEVDENGCALDSDKDGVADYLDKCPNTPKGVEVDENGCAIDSDKDKIPNYLDKCPNTPNGIIVDKYGCALDSDGDEIADSFDKCPNTPKGVKVNKYGCPLDDDGDGVPNYLDKCPNTKQNVKVNNQGCEIIVTYIFNFKFDSYKIEKKYYPEIKKLADTLKENPNIKIEIDGHTDNIGSKEYNYQLSLKRANALKNILINEYKIAPKRIKIKGFGATKPIASNKTPEGRAKNRRVVVINITNITK